MPTTTRLDPLAENALKTLQKRIESEEGRKASREEIVSALVYGATPSQAAGMLIAFTRAVAQGSAESESAGSMPK
jgi:hypothetical protein